MSKGCVGNHRTLHAPEAGCVLGLRFNQATIIFVVFLIVGLLMILVPHQIDLAQSATETALQKTLPLIGSVMLTSGLVFFLLEMTRLDREKVN